MPPIQTGPSAEEARRCREGRLASGRSRFQEREVEDRTRGLRRRATSGVSTGNPRRRTSEPLRAEESELARLRIGLKAEFGRLFFEFVADPQEFAGRGSAQGRDRRLQVLEEGRFSWSAISNPRSAPSSSPRPRETDFIDRSMAADRLAPIASGAPRSAVRRESSGTASAVSRAMGRRSPRAPEPRAPRESRIEAVKGLVLGGSFMQGKVEPDPRDGRAASPRPRARSGGPPAASPSGSALT